MEEAFEVISDLLAQYELHGVAPSETTAWVDWDPDDEIAVLDLGGRIGRVDTPRGGQTVVR